MKAFLKKTAVILGIVAVLGILALVDTVISKTYAFELLSVERISDGPVYDAYGEPVPSDWGVADGQTKVVFSVLLTRNGKPVSGHVLYAKTNRNVIGRIATDENGVAVIEYRCYKGNKSNVKPVTLSLRDEDNSVFITVSARAEYVLQMAAPAVENGNGMMTDDIFYDISR